MSKWKNPPPVTIIAGTQDYFRRRELQLAQQAAGRVNRQIESLDGANRGSLVRVLSSGGVFFSDKTLAVIRNPEKVDPKVVIAHHEGRDNDVAIILYYEGDPTAKKKSVVAAIAGAIGKKLVVNFQAPKGWEADEYAEKFVAKEIKRLKLTMSEGLVRNLVTIVGNDLGVLSWEIAKIAAICSADGVAEVSAPALRQSVASIMEAGAQPVVEHLARRNTPRLARALVQMRRTHANDPTMKGIAFVGKNILQWLHAAALISGGNSGDEISREIGVHPYIFKTKISPAAKKWGEKNLVDLLNILADVERGIKSGHVNPWVEFEAALLVACRGSARG